MRRTSGIAAAQGKREEVTHSQTLALSLTRRTKNSFDPPLTEKTRQTPFILTLSDGLALPCCTESTPAVADSFRSLRMLAALTVRERTPKKSSSSRNAGEAEGRVTFHPVATGATAAAGVGADDGAADDDLLMLFEGRNTVQPSDIFIYSNEERKLFLMWRFEREEGRGGGG